MRQIPLQAVPNQRFTIALDGSNYDITLRTTAGVLSASITRDTVLLFQNIRTVSGAPLIPYRYLEGGGGNFTFLTQAQQLPEYSKFNLSQFLIYFSAAELAILRQPAPTPIAETCFNPIGALPLRYRPQGY